MKDIVLEVNDYDVATEGEFRTDIGSYRKKMEILGIDEEKIKETIKEKAHIGNQHSRLISM